MSYRKLIYVAAMILLLLNIGATFAAEHGRYNLTISKIHPIAGERPGAPNLQNIIRIYVNPGPWDASSCRQDSGDLLKSDSHLLSVILTAWTTGKTIDLIVEDTLVPSAPGTTCQITGVFVQ